MKFIEVIEGFLENQEQENELSTSRTYKRKIYAFYEYVLIERKAQDVNFISILSTMTIEELLKSVEYYVKAGNIKFKATVDVYFAVLGNFYKYIFAEYGWTNRYFQQIDCNEEFKKAYERKIKELKLSESQQEKPLTSVNAMKLLSVCNDKIDNVSLDDIEDGKKGAYSNYVSSIITKLVLLYGIRNSVVKELRIEDYNEDLNKLKINGFQIALPDKLALQMKKYRTNREIFLKGEKCDRLFFDNVDVDKDMDNTKMFSIMSSVFGNNQARAVAKCAIVQMIRNKVPTHVIMDFTGYKEEVCKFCQEWVDDENGILRISEKCKVLDSALRRNELFDEM